MSWQERTLAELTTAADLHHHVLLDADEASYEVLDQVIASLPGPLAEIVATVHAVTGQAVLGRR